LSTYGNFSPFFPKQYFVTYHPWGFSFFVTAMKFSQKQKAAKPCKILFCKHTANMENVQRNKKKEKGEL
jgi:hypothetical protein